MAANVYFCRVTITDSSRKSLDHRRLEEAHLKFCTLDVYQKFKEDFSNWGIKHNLYQTLDDITPVLHKAFCTKFAGQ